MAGTVVADLEIVSLCEDATGWTGAPIPAQNDTTIWDAIQGTRCLQSYSAGAAVRNASYDFGAGNLKDFTGKLLYFWFAFSKKLYSASAGIMKLRLTDSSGYYRDWYVFDKNSLPNTSWISWAIHAQIGYDYESNVNFNVAQIRYVAWRIEDTVLGKTYIWWDAWRWGTGLTLKLGTSGSPATIENLYTADIDSANAYGVISKISGVYLIQGQIKIGSTVNAEATYFKDTNKVVIFRSIKGNPSTFSKILFQGNAGADTEIHFGEAIGGKGVSGLFISSESSSCRFALDATSTSRMKWQLCGTTFFQARAIQFPAYDASWLREVLNSNFEKCEEVIANTTTMSYCNFISAVDKAVKIESASHKITHCNFISNPDAIEITIATTISFSYLIFSGNTYVVLNSSGSPITVEYANSESDNWNYDPAGSAVTFQTSVALIIRHVKTGSEPAEYARCYIRKKESPYTEIMNMDAAVADDQNPTYYKASMTYSVTGIVVVVRAREKGWLPFEIELTISSSGLDVTAVWIPDPNYQ